MPEKTGDAQLLGRVVLDQQQPLLAGLHIGLHPSNRLRQPFGRRRLGDEGKCAVGQSVLTVFVQRDDLHRYVARERILLQLAQDGPSKHVGQKHVERDGRRLILLGKLERVGAPH